MRGREVALIRELLALYAKYGGEAFEVAVRQIRAGEMAELIADTADAVRRAAQNRRASAIRAGEARPRKTKREIAIERIAGMKGTGRKTDAVIAGLAERILNREVLPTPASLREYMELIGMPVSGRHTERNDALFEVTDYLRGLPEAEVIRSVDAVQNLRTPVSSLQRWADIIVKPDRN